ncbi:hypothetical protein M4951_12405 [Blastopirellula sp. J2-11]|uniref:hypothetical protein n=1 Tax=Blastopirellula sp. J2-11 TaxID=2943192 RepID=UPI0021C5706E|nr:hypothetical protein [Blastopirellula sp. J2-11]UUO09085.1 hypothetical protein M4951_12405 [Blastopirellula sp. J2-11]
MRYRDSMAPPTCNAACQTATVGASHGHNAQGPDHQVVSYDQPMIPPRPKFHPVPTRPAFAPRVEYSPPELMRRTVEVEMPLSPEIAPPAPIQAPALMPAPPAEAISIPPVKTNPPQPLPPPTVHARPIIAPLPQQIDLDQPAEIRPIQGMWRTKSAP